MGKHRRYKNIVEMFLASEKGRRILNFCYSWGASVIILGAMFKLLHLPYANWVIGISMTFEAIVFFIFGFERPSDEYNWEAVFPVLKSKNPLDRPTFENGGGNGGRAVHIEGAGLDGGTQTIIVSGGAGVPTEGSAITEGSILGGGLIGGIGNIGVDVSENDAKTLTDSIIKLNGAAEQISKMADLTEATQSYLDQIAAMSQNMERFSQVTNSLADVSDTLLNSYQAITNNSEGIDQNSRGYVNQMEQLNRNISGLNTIYEIQLKGISSQIDNIERINNGLSRIRDMYDGSITDSTLFRTENEKMAQLLSQLNNVYSRLLQAMTVYMAAAGGDGNPYQPSHQRTPYQPNNPYSTNPDQSRR